MVCFIERLLYHEIAVCKIKISLSWNSLDSSHNFSSCTHVFKLHSVHQGATFFSIYTVAMQLIYYISLLLVYRVSSQRLGGVKGMHIHRHYMHALKMLERQDLTVRVSMQKREPTYSAPSGSHWCVCKQRVQNLYELAIISINCIVVRGNFTHDIVIMI